MQANLRQGRALAVGVVMASLPTWAHSGGLDRFGCHGEGKNGGYHCHKPAQEGDGATRATTIAPAAATEGTPPPAPTESGSPQGAPPPAGAPAAVLPPEKEPSTVQPQAKAAAAPDGYPDDLLRDQILWGGLTYLGGEVVAGLCPPLVLGLPFASAYVVSNQAEERGYAADWGLPGLAALGGALGAGVVTWGGALGLCLGSGLAANALSNGRPTGAVSALPAGLAIGFFALGALAQPFVASTAAALTFKARAQPKVKSSAVAARRPTQGRVVRAMAY